MKISIILKVASMLYSSIFRDLLIKAIDDPDEEWDDAVLHICDSIFGYTSEEN